MTAAAAIGMTKDEVDEFIKRLTKCFDKCKPVAKIVTDSIPVVKTDTS